MKKSNNNYNISNHRAKRKWSAPQLIPVQLKNLQDRRNSSESPENQYRIVRWSKR